MEERKWDAQKMIEKLIAFEAQLEVLKCECCKARTELERIYAPAPRKGKIDKYALTAKKIVLNRNSFMYKSSHR